MRRLIYFSQILGLHPLTTLGLFSVDWMLFGQEVATAGVGWLISLPVGLMLGLAAVSIQKHVYKDSSMAALAKGLLVGLLTAIPTPLSSFGLLPSVAFGAIRILSPRERAASASQLTPVPSSRRL